MTDIQVEKIEEFLTGKMSPEEHKDFEQELESNEALFAEYNTYRDIETYLSNSRKYADENELKKSLTKLGAEFFNTTANDLADKQEEPTAILSPPLPGKSGRVKSIQIWRLVAAIFLGIIALSIIWYQLDNKKNMKDQAVIAPKVTSDSTGRHKTGIDSASPIPSSPNLAKQDSLKNREFENSQPVPSNLGQEKRLVAKYFKPDAPPENKEGPLADAFDLYESGQYKNAATAFEDADLNVSNRGETDTLLTRFYASYYEGLSYMATNEDMKAISQLSGLTINDAELQAKSLWYLALAYLRLGNTQKALLLLREVQKIFGVEELGLKANELIAELKKEQ